MTTDQNTNDPRFVFVFAWALDGAGGSHPVATQTAEPRWYHLDIRSRTPGKRCPDWASTPA